MTRAPHRSQTRSSGGSARGRTAALVLVLALAAAPAWPAASAQADVGTTIIERCTHGKSVAGYTQQAYRRALQELPTEVEEYSDCGNVIRRAQLAAAGGAGVGAAGPLSTTPTPLTPSEQLGISAVVHRPAAPLRVGNELVNPGVVHANVSSALSSLPTPLLATLALIAAAALAFAGRAIRNRVWKRTAG